MDRMIYVGMTGAKQAMEQQASIANNMANVSTPGFRAQVNNYRAVPVVGDEMTTRAMVVSTTPSADMRAGPISQTGRSLDVAIRGDGWLVVQMPDNTEAFTRVGNLQVAADGQITTMDARPVSGESGGLVVPPGSTLVIADDGSISSLSAGGAKGGATVGKLKLVNPSASDLERGDDGLFRMKAGAETPPSDPGVKIISGSLEGSNVNPVQAMVEMIANARMFEMQMKTLSTAEANDQQANKLLSNT